jgi:hypothetical protein
LIKREENINEDYNKCEVTLNPPKSSSGNLKNVKKIKIEIEKK